MGPRAYLDVESLATLAAAEGLLSFRMFAAVVAPEFVETDKRLLAFGASGRNLLVMPGLQGAAERG